MKFPVFFLSNDWNVDIALYHSFSNIKFFRQIMKDSVCIVVSYAKTFNT